MRLASLALLGLAASLTGCAPGGTSLCQTALDRLSACADAYCAEHADQVCSILNQGNEGSLLGDVGPCDTMNEDELRHLATASCDQLLDEAALLAAGKADFPCPSYFPWCNALAPGNAAYLVNLRSFDAEGAELEIIIPDIGRAKTTHQGRTFHSLFLAGAGSLGEVGRPALPTVSFLIGVPSGTDAAWVEHFEAIDQRSVSSLVPLPAQPSRLEDEAVAPFVFDEAFYRSSTVYPTAEHAVDGIATWRNYRVVRVTLHPVRYVPAAQELTVAGRMLVRLGFADQAAETKDTIDEGEQAMAQSYATTLVNYPEIHAAEQAGQQDDPDRVRYLVIAHDPLVDALQPLIALKESQGLKTEVVRLSEVGAEPEKIKARILQSYQASAIEYVLLVGHAQALPMGMFPTGYAGLREPIPGDYWYSLLAGDDLLAEVSVGRILATTPEAASLHIGKIISYERGENAAAWRKNMLLIAHEEQFPGKYTACQESVRTRAYRGGPFEFGRLYGGAQATTEQLVGKVNQGVGLIAYRGHGSEDAWYEWNRMSENFAGGDTRLQNGEKTPVVFSIACLNSALTHATPSNAEQWVLHPQGGAVAFLGATLPSWTLANDDFERQIFRTFFDDGVSAIGPLVDRARAALMAQRNNDADGNENASMYLWLGDPSLEMTRPVRTPRIGWCNLQWPPTLEVAKGSTDGLIFGQVWAEGFSESVGQGNGVAAELGIGPQGSDPAGPDWSWTPARYNLDKGNNDEYMATPPTTEAGAYSYAFRCKGETDADWTLCDLDGSQNGVAVGQLGTLTVR